MNAVSSRIRIIPSYGASGKRYGIYNPNMRKKSREERDTIRNRLSRLKFRATELEVKIDTELFDEARVVACTLVGSANRVMMNRHFTTLFIDEAAQALEAACWIAIGKADRVILAGDHHQLPPYY